MRIPRLCHHRGSEQGYCTYQYRSIYFGHWPRDRKTPPPEVEREYERWVAALLRERGDEPPRTLGRHPTVVELWAAYLAHCEAYYVQGGQQTSEVGVIIMACRVAARLAGDKLTSEYTVQDLRTTRDEIAKTGRVRDQVNKAVQRIRSMFRWGVENGHVPASVLAELKALSPLKKGRTASPESPGIRPVSWAEVERSMVGLRAPLPDLVRVHWLLGCRAEDVCAMRVCELVDSPTGKRFVPTSAKTDHHEHLPKLRYEIGPQAWEILSRRIAGLAADAWVFPAFRLRGGRRREDKGEPSPYTTSSYRRAIARHCCQLGLPVWTPLQIRHGRATEIRAKFRAEGAQAVAKHRNLRTTEVYAEVSDELARRIMNEMG